MPTPAAGSPSSTSPAATSPGAAAHAGAVFEPLVEGHGACSIRIPVFDGPLDLLLHLIREQELDIVDLPIAQVARQYLEYLELLRELHLDLAAEYLVMAATLAWIKSRLLLPPDPTEAEEEGGDPRAELVARLLEYQRFQAAAADLGTRPLLGREVFAPPGEEPPPLPEAEREIQVGLLQLVEALRRALRKAHAADVVHEVVTETVTVRERMVAVIDALAASEVVEFESLLHTPEGRWASRAVLVTTFLAILELARLSALRIFQSRSESGAPEGPIRLRRAEGVDPLGRLDATA
jgi:segregation and condensation protein A